MSLSFVLLLKNFIDYSFFHFLSSLAFICIKFDFPRYNFLDVNFARRFDSFSSFIECSFSFWQFYFCCWLLLQNRFLPPQVIFFSFLYITICSTMHFFLQLFFAYNNFLPVELSLSSVSLLYFVSILSISKLLWIGKDTEKFYYFLRTKQSVHEGQSVRIRFECAAG